MISKKLKKRHKPGWYLIATLIVVASFYGLSKSGKGLIKIWRLSRMRKTEDKIFNEAVQRKKELNREIERLTKDSTYIEEIARKEYGMKKNDEEVFIISFPDTETEVDEDAR